MKKIYASVIGVDEGELLLFSDFQDGGPMWADVGPREKSAKIAFAESFREAPSVQVFVKLLDLAGETNVRYDLASRHVTSSGFEVVFRTWSDTKIARVGIAWRAIGAARHDDDFDDIQGDR